MTNLEAQRICDAARRRLQQSGCPVDLNLSHSSDGWPIVVRIINSANAEPVELGRFEPEPLEDESAEAMTDVLVNAVHALYDEAIEGQA